MNLPVVSLQTIAEVGNDATQDVNRLYNEFAVSNPDLYRTIYGIYQLETTTKETMLGMIVAMYHVLDREMGKHKQLRKRVRKNVG